MKEDFTRYEAARILGARALQISMDAPVLLDISKEELIDIKFDPLKIAEKEFYSGVLPITIKRPLPRKSEEKLKKIKKVEKEISDEEIRKKEEQEEKEIREEGEIMELARPEDEVEEQGSEEEGIE